MSEGHVKDLIDEVTGFVKEDGYEVIDTRVNDYGRTVKLVIEKDGRKSILPITECYYDTDPNGVRTKFHGVINIADSEWYRNKRADGADTGKEV